jgi:DNA-directed RNA polymerase subunit alpha
MELTVKIGRGFCPSDENKKPGQAIGIVAIDSLFSPVTRVRYAVEAARVGNRTDYDRLVLEIWTDGRITPDDALTQASAILAHHLDVFVGFTTRTRWNLKRRPTSRTTRRRSSRSC